MVYSKGGVPWEALKAQESSKMLFSVKEVAGVFVLVIGGGYKLRSL